VKAFVAIVLIIALISIEIAVVTMPILPRPDSPVRIQDRVAIIPGRAMVPKVLRDKPALPLDRG
jgi:hypothetical protein